MDEPCTALCTYVATACCSPGGAAYNPPDVSGDGGYLKGGSDVQNSQRAATARGQDVAQHIHSGIIGPVEISLQHEPSPDNTRICLLYPYLIHPSCIFISALYPPHHP